MSLRKLLFIAKQSCPHLHRTPATLSSPSLPLNSLIRCSSGPVTGFLSDPACGEQAWDTQHLVLGGTCTFSERSWELDGTIKRNTLCTLPWKCKLRGSVPRARGASDQALDGPIPQRGKLTDFRLVECCPQKQKATC